MIPGVNPRQMKQMMRQMGMSQEDISATEILIKTSDGKVLVFDNPQVQKVTMQGQATYQITGTPRVEEVKLSIEISNDDIDMVSEQAKVTKEEAKKALESTKGDIAEAILSLE